MHARGAGAGADVDSPAGEPTGHAKREEEAAAGEGPQVREAIAGISRQIDQIIGSAEQFADHTRVKAETEGQELLERRSREAEHVAVEREAAARELVDRVDAAMRELLASVSSLRERTVEAAQDLESAVARVERDLERLKSPEAEGQDGPGEVAGSTAAARVPGPSGGSPGDGAAESGAHHAARAANPPVVLASQMALSGMSREEIAETLRGTFGIADPEPIVDRALAGKP
jgi:hypothetical protein